MRATLFLATVDVVFFFLCFFCFASMVSRSGFRVVNVLVFKRIVSCGCCSDFPSLARRNACAVRVFDVSECAVVAVFDPRYGCALRFFLPALRLCVVVLLSRVAVMRCSLLARVAVTHCD